MRIGHIALVAALAAVACKKESSKQNEPAKTDENRAAAANLTAPALFASIPADTPYVFAAFEPLPASYWDAIGGALRPELEKLLDQMLQLPANEPQEKFLHGLARELRGNLTAAGIKKVLGISADKRWALYGVGVVPVFRLELADAKALSATIAKLSAESGVTLPTATAGGKSYYRFDDGDVLVVGAVLDDQLVIAGGPKAMVEKGLPFILGTEKPQPSMADGGALKEVTARHGFAGYGSGYVDSAKLLNVLMMADLMKSASGGGGMPDSCKPELQALSKRFPRLAFGYDEISPSRAAMRMVLEMEPALVTRLKEIEVEVPGMAGGKMADKALIAIGGGVDIGKARAVGIDFADGLARFGTACGVTDVVENAAEAKQAFSQPMPPFVDKIRGGLVALLSAELAGGKPSGVDGFAFVISDEPGALVDMAMSQMPTGNAPKIAKDGKFHEVVPANAIPGVAAIKAAVKEKAVVLATGASGEQAAERALGQKGKAPLFFLSYDYGRILKMGGDALAQMGGGGMPGMNPQMAQMFGLAAIWAYVSDHGLAISLTMEMKP
jgi:hypothetical protein